jgi:hypothetical protein
MAEYQGHRSWNAWTVALTIRNNADLYFRARDLKKLHGTEEAARLFLKELPKRTPEGGKYNLQCVREAIATIGEP